MSPGTAKPAVTFWVGEPPAKLTAADSQWRLPLPADRHSGPATLPTISYGDYFRAVEGYLHGEGRAALALAVRRHWGHDLSWEELDAIRIHLVKHGAFYHPAKLTVSSGTHRLPLVLNVAVSPAGIEHLSAEAAYLQRLSSDFPECFVPRVYGWGCGHLEARQSLPMFLGEWLGGFHELHPTGNPDGPWAVWDPDRGRWHLDERQVADFFRQAVFILTFYFDPHTLEAIQAWHLAAGDFVVRDHAGELQVRLITVRRYGPLFHLEKDDPLTIERLLEALTVFFLRTSLWMRLDRLDGVGDLVWARDAVVRPMWQGFVEGLERMAQRNDFPDSFVAGVTAYLAGHGMEEWMAMGETIIARIPAEMPEVVLLRNHLARHAALLPGIIKAREPGS